LPRAWLLSWRVTALKFYTVQRVMLHCSLQKLWRVHCFVCSSLSFFLSVCFRCVVCTI
jgi:hypothetical protein